MTIRDMLEVAMYNLILTAPTVPDEGYESRVINGLNSEQARVNFEHNLAMAMQHGVWLRIAVVDEANEEHCILQYDGLGNAGFQLR